MVMDILARARNLLLSPSAEWRIIAAEATSVERIYRDYVLYLAAIGPIAGFIGTSLIGIDGARIGLVSGLVLAVLRYVITLAMLHVMAIVIDRLAPHFGGRSDFLSAFKLAAYGMTAAWLANVFTIVPALGLLAIVGLYSVYLLFAGAPVLMRIPTMKTSIYTIAVVLIGLLLNFLVGSVLAALLAPPFFPG
ncbi:Yip1 family protein [Labrys neptuniae]|uniref:Yip1 family protein n=1 Tax=Labrys neptuniae TaxID=376174 RepID=UPI0028910DFC|nr:Yip1 family protein [Labrys neptuniae]MDT3376501.1 Yip1 family protein [Labrys neptuniae]